MPAYPFPLQKLFFSKEEEEKGGGGKSFVQPLSIPFPFGNQSSHREEGKGRLVPFNSPQFPLFLRFSIFFKGRLKKLLLSVYAWEVSKAERPTTKDMIYYLKSFAFLFGKLEVAVYVSESKHREDNFLNPFQTQTGMKVLDA